MSAGLKGAFDAGDRFADLSARTGVAVKDLVVLDRAFQNAGMSGEQVGPSINRLQKALAGVNEDGEPTNAMFQRLGLSMETLQGLDPGGQFTAVGKAISSIADPTDRAAAAMGIFGKSGGELLALFADAGAFGDAAAQVGTQAEILQRNAVIFGKISDQLGLVGTKVQGFFVGVADKVAPVLTPLMDFFAGADFAAIGQRLGDSLALGIQALTDGSIWSILLDSAKVAIGSAINFLWAGMQSAIVGAGLILFEKFKMARELISILGTVDFWKGAGNQLLAFASSFNAMIHGSFARIVELMRPMLSKIGLGGAADKASGYLRGKSQAMNDTAEGYQQAANAAFVPAMERLSSRAAEAWDNVASAMANAFNDSVNLVDVGSAQDSLSQSIDKLADKVTAAQGRFAWDAQKDRRTGKLNLEGEGKEPGRGEASVSRLISIAGFSGIFIKDTLLGENRRQTAELQRQTALLEQIAKQKTPPLPAIFDPMLRFA
ncbi:MAG: hypothetical protein IAE97_05500 [Chthoniobacterales bacterium]|nr:hypothetical protein [Chthoniobacterales bacterium]